MNFLAHLHIAEHCNSDLQGNLLGDFAKGDPSKHYPLHVADGIRLHRFVDRFTDTHPLVKEQKILFETSLKRFAPIALDMFWDHCLAYSWPHFHSLPLRQFIQKCQRECQNRDYDVPDSYKTTMNAMWTGEWLLSYRDVDSVIYALERMSHRSPRMAPLADCGDTLLKHYSELTQIFFQFYPQVLQQAKIYTLK